VEGGAGAVPGRAVARPRMAATTRELNCIMDSREGELCREEGVEGALKAGIGPRMRRWKLGQVKKAVLMNESFWRRSDPYLYATI
jgi:hypothetical protein